MLKHFASAFLLPMALFATDFNPFFPPQLYIDAKADYLFQNFQQVRKNGKKKDYHSNDHFLHLSGGLTYDVYNGELEITAADTRHRSFGFDEARLTGRYQILSDFLNDNQSLVVGITAMQTVQQALEDIGSFHHGKIAGMIHAAFGHELTHQQFWTQRFWGMFGFGSADVGSPWIQSILVWDRNCYNIHQFRIYAKGLYGFGGDEISLHRFKGYGPIAHRSLDLGVRYDYTTEWCGTWGIGYAYRIYARNFPCNVNFLSVHYEILLGTGI